LKVVSRLPSEIGQTPVASSVVRINPLPRGLATIQSEICLGILAEEVLQSDSISVKEARDLPPHRFKIAIVSWFTS
jgi:hypothetical protein